jgi:N-acetylmuramoyl-L-alanine amidase
VAKHNVVPGDCFCSLAKANNFFDYLTLYNHGSNAALKAKRPNPNQLVEGDSVEIPDKKIKKVLGATNKEHKFLVLRTKTKLRLVIVNAQDMPLKTKTCTLTVGARAQKTKPAASGLVEMEVDPVDTAGSLAITLAPPKRRPKPKAAKAATPTSPPPYPAPIVSKDFIDENEMLTIETSLTWTLRVGSMEPKDTIRGVLRRLFNLGYTAPDVTVEDAKTAAVVKSYQRKNALAAKDAESGKVADVQVNLETRHDKL